MKQFKKRASMLMLSTVSLLSGFILLLFLQSCFCKQYCGEHIWDRIKFEGYTKNDIDSTKIVKYKKSTALATVVDTFFVDSSIVEGDSTQAEITIPTEQHYIDVNYDYKLILNAGTEYTLTEITVELKKSKCGFWDKGCRYLELINYKINGQVVNKSHLRIIK